MKTQISVILPIYNIQTDYLMKCFDSLLNQTFDHAEYIMIDDGSENYVQEICRQYSAVDSRFKYIRIDHSGVSEARNIGITNAEGEYICFVDPDDWLSEVYLDALYRLIEESKADIAMVDSIVHYPSRTVENHFLNSGKTILKGNEKNRLLYQCIGKKICEYYPSEIAAGIPWCKIFRSSFLKNKGLKFVPEMPRMQDNIFSLYTYENAGLIAYEPLCLYHYRKNNESVSHRYNPDIIRQFEIYYSETQKYLDSYNKEQILYEALYMKELTSFNSYLSYYFYEIKDRSTSDINREIDLLLTQEPYSTALQHISKSNLTNQEYIFVFCLKYHFHSILRLLVHLRNKRFG